ncbi:MAG: alpha-L-rhamnosidase N-terminal domain-containing protein, partial [Proteiniphilum sp.]|nr:alpha-L-rhamnosidase N-terminal domain-containing protein [Proteiniphilum sp.]
MNRSPLLLILFFIFSQTVSHAQSVSKPFNLRTDHLENPTGIDNPNPRLMWMMDDHRPGAGQAAFKVIVGSDSLQVLNGEGDIWNTGKTDAETRLITYKGKKLGPFTKYYWKVILWDKEKRESASSVNTFETGMMGINNWQGSWIGDGRDIHFKPASYFRKEFPAKKEIQSARAYIAVAGLYELYINGEKIGNHRLDPMYTRFDRRNLYVTHDVTSQLQNGANA